MWEPDCGHRKVRVQTRSAQGHHARDLAGTQPMEGGRGQGGDGPWQGGADCRLGVCVRSPLSASWMPWKRSGAEGEDGFEPLLHRVLVGDLGYVINLPGPQIDQPCSPAGTSRPFSVREAGVLST